MLLDELLGKLENFGEMNFAVHEILRDIWQDLTNGERRNVGREFYKIVKNGQLNRSGWRISPIDHTSPQRYKKYRDGTPSIEDASLFTEGRFLDINTDVKDDMKLMHTIQNLDWAGLRLQIVRKPPPIENKE